MRFLIADDHPLYRDALRSQIERLFPDVEVDEASSFDDILQRAGKEYALYLIDYRMPGMSIAVLKELALALPDIPIAVISGAANTTDVKAMIQAGARGFIPKTVTGAHLGHALQLLLAGGTSVPSDMLKPGDAAGTADEPSWLAKLSAREHDVLKAVARGLTNKEIGRELGLAEVTIKLHLRSVFRKIGARSRSEAAVIATKAHIA